MISSTPSLLLLSLFGLILEPTFTNSAQDFPLFSKCNDYDLAINKSSYIDRLDALFSSLISNASSSTNNGFFATTTTAVLGFGSPWEAKETIYGLFLCRGDISSDECSLSVFLLTKDLLDECSNHKSGVMYYDNCMVRYSNKSFLGHIEEWNFGKFLNPGSINSFNIDPKKFKNKVCDTLRQLTKETASGEPKKSGSKKYFKTKNIKLTNVELFTLAQCTPDLKPNDCKRCLSLATNEVPKLCNDRRGCGVMNPSCYTRFELYPFYVSDAVSPPPLNRKSVQLKIVIPISITAFVIIIVLISGVIARKKTKKNNDVSIFERADGDDSTIESLQCGLEVLQVATNNFADENMIGKGGFGVVYKGTLPNGKHIAVKKLFLRSLKVEKEFKNEMKVVARLQHKNLVKLLAFCLERGERLLVFEYVPNKSLDYFIFDAEKSEELDWRTRFNIIEGVARGLLYLHEDSRLTIIHRDLKPSNILLEYDMKPKIADFGMARIFGMGQTLGSFKPNTGKSWQHSGADHAHQSTSNIGGTLGYMALDYIQTQRFSLKTDVYSFGVIVLEIISGKRNRTFYQSGLATDLLSHAWTQLREGTPLKLIDARLGGSYIAKEVIRCIHLGLLCVQTDPNARPSMWDVVHLMLNTSLNDELPMPQLPSFCAPLVSDGQSSSMSSEQNNTSVNDVSITEQLPR